MGWGSERLLKWEIMILYHFLLVIACLVTNANPAATLQVKVAGTRNRLIMDNDISFSDISESLVNATVYDGSIVFMEETCETFSRQDLMTLFEHLREIRGFLQVNSAGICLQDLGFFKNLRVIRGIYSTEHTPLREDVVRTKFALSIFANSQFPAQLRMQNLRMVTQHGIFISGNQGPNRLCGRGQSVNNDGVNFEALIPTPKLDSVSFFDNERVSMTFQSELQTGLVVEYALDHSSCSAPFCHPNCNGSCWGSGEDQCQFICTANCGSQGCYENYPEHCCPEMCLGGCDTENNGTLLCHACADGYILGNTGTCILPYNEPCSNGFYPTGFKNEFICSLADNEYFITEDTFYCNEKCRGNPDDVLAIENGKCVSLCKSGRSPEPITNECMPLPEGEEPYTPCQSAFHVVTRCTLDALEHEDCNTLQGSISVQEPTLAYASTRELEFLSKLRRILGSVAIITSPLPSLQSLRNIEFIEGRDDAALYLFDNPLLTSLPLTSLQSVPSVLISSSPNLCFLATRIDFKDRLPTTQESFGFDLMMIDIFAEIFDRNRPYYPLSYASDFIHVPGALNREHPACANIKCDDLCGGFCWGPGEDDCQRCQPGKILHDGVCINGTTCPLGYYSNSWSCRRCHTTCKNCNGPQRNHCTSCPLNRFLKSGNCELQCGDGFFRNNTERMCSPCAPQCTTCQDADNLCNSCKFGYFLRHDDNRCVTGGNCPNRTYADVAQRECLPCRDHCIVCDGIICKVPESGFFINTEHNLQAIKSCIGGSEFEEFPATFTSDRVCSRISSCEVDEQYRVAAHTSTTDTVCANCTVCAINEERVVGTCNGIFDAVCQVIDLCSNSPCENDGGCTSINGTVFECNCTGTGYRGEFCEVRIAGSGLNEQEELLKNVGAGIAGLLGLVAVLVGALRMRECFYTRTYRPVKDIRSKAPTDVWEIERERLVLGKIIGEGNFGRVSRGLLRAASNDLANIPAEDVAVKQLKGKANGTAEEDEFFKEMELMKSLGKHKHVMSLVGVCTLDDPILLVIEFAEQGDLKTFLRGKRPSPTQPDTLSDEEKINFAAQIASGMSFLAYHKIVHRDLAARNVLIASGNVLKISDFGLARDVYEDNFYQKKTAGKIAFKWMAPECIKDRVFTSASDVWSFGITLWEIVTLAQVPYPAMSNYEVVQALQAGYRMPPPENCDDRTYSAMRKCWQENPNDRPTFDNLMEYLTSLAGKPQGYYIDNNAGEKPELMSYEVIRRLQEDPDRPYIIPTLQRSLFPDLGMKRENDADGYLEPTIQRHILATLSEEDEKPSDDMEYEEPVDGFANNSSLAIEETMFGE